MVKKRSKASIALFIDAANIFYSQKTLGWRVDYEKFLAYWGKKGRITGAYFYTAVISTNKKQLQFFKALKEIGYTVIAVVSARGHIARELARKANEYIPLEKLKNEIIMKV